MARKKKKHHPAGREPKLHPETKDSIVAITAFLFALIFLFAWFEKAGKIGVWLLDVFTKLLGQGYMLLPLSLVLVGTALLFSLKQKCVARQRLDIHTRHSLNRAGSWTCISSDTCIREYNSV